ncbi:hypothetical protein PybrP1_008071 [[Pythium] brassicae (nom. inval.)]|nr:hypothetical protein PybrP1_008071 [[Pythium] brassicae (nom. inval.)]
MATSSMAVAPLPSHSTPATSAASTNANANANSARQVVTLPRLRIPSDSDVFAQQQSQVQSLQMWTPTSAFQSQFAPLQMLAGSKQASPVGQLTRSPSSPAAFFQDPDNKFGLTHLLEAAEQCLPVPVALQSVEQTQTQSQTQNQLLRKRSFSEQPSPLFLQPARMPSLAGFLTPVDESDRSYKRPRPDAYQLQPQSLSQYPTQQLYEHEQSFLFQPSFSHSSPASAPVFEAPGGPTSSSSSPGGAGSPVDVSTTGSCLLNTSSGGAAVPSMIWETVLASGEFPAGVGLSESASQSLAADASDADGDSGAVKQGRWSCDEKQFAEAMIQSVHRGEAVLPPNVSLRRYIAGNLQCKAMRVSKKFRSLRASQSPASPTGTDDPEQGEKRFNPLSLRSIMNTSEGASVNPEQLLTPSSVPENTGSAPSQRGPLTTEKPAATSSGVTKKSQRVLKRSDYSQHGTVRSGRWSLEEENYAKAMIEAFKNGYLPLHGNVSLRKFLSEVLVCHPMRISKKFVGYVRKYHWYRIAAGQSEPEAKQAALLQLAHLERVFWASMQQSTEWVGQAVAATQSQPQDE